VMAPVTSLSMNSNMPSKYRRLTRPEMLELIPESAARVIDIGCGEGGFGRLIKDRQDSEVWGLELDAAAAGAAEKKLDRVICGDAVTKVTQLPDTYFDCIVCNDILEHFVEPEEFLNILKAKLSPDGKIVCSIPNVRYFFVLYDLVIRKRWEYQDAGVLDRTHLRFFTKESIVLMFERLGFKVEQIHGVNGFNSWKFNIINGMTLGFLSDTKYPQFACRVGLR